MKTTVWMTFALVFLSTAGFAQRQYYYSNNRKIFIDPDSTTIVSYYKKAVNENSLIAKIKGNTGQSSVKTMQIGKAKAMLLNNSGTSLRKLFDTVGLKYDEVYFRLPLYKLGKDPMYFTNQVVLEPKSGIAISQILNLVKGEVDSVTTTPYHTYILNARKNANVFAIANKIYESNLVKWCQPDFLAPIVLYSVPPDPYYANQYYLKNTGQNGGTAGIDINVEPAWDLTLGSSTLRVAIIDQGVEAHEDMAGRVLSGYTPVNNGNGAPAADYTTNPQNNTCARVGHGLATAGIVAASQNTIGISGIAPNSLIVPVNILAGGETAQDIANGINWAWDPAHGNADVLSNSWGFNTTDPSLIPYSDLITAAITNARTLGRGGKGCPVIFASGNSNGTTNGLFPGVTYPANVNGVITVGAIDNTGNIRDYSSRGAEMDLVAPSGGAGQASYYLGCTIPDGDVYTTDRMGAAGYTSGNYTTTFNGTSAACPQVSGAAALMLSIAPDLTETQVRTMLQQTARDLGATGFDNTYGYGLLNTYAAVNAARNTTTFITGPKYICSSSSSVYSINALPAGATVSWSIPSSAGPVLVLNPNSPGTNQLTITNQGWYQVSTTLTATVMVGSNPPVNYTLAIANDNASSGSGYAYTQDACLYYNVSHPAQSGTTSGATFVHMGCDVRVTLNLPSNKTVALGSGGGTPVYWFYSGGILYFALPIGSGGIPFTFNIVPKTNDGSCTSSILFFPYSNNGNSGYAYKVAPNPVSNTLNIVATDNSAIPEASKDAALTTQSNQPAKKKLQYTAKIYDIVYSKYIMTHKTSNGELIQNFDVSSLRPGNYVVIIEDGTQSVPVKFIKN